MEDTFRLDLAEYDKEYIEDVLRGFLEGAKDHGRKVVKIRMSKAMIDRLAIEPNQSTLFEGVALELGNTGFEGTIEIILGPVA